MEAKLEELGKMCLFKKDASFNVLQFCIQTHFLWVQLLRRYELFKKIMFDHFFSLHENRDGQLAGLMEAKTEKLGKICTNRKYVSFYVLQFCICAKFLLVKPFRSY